MTFAATLDSAVARPRALLFRARIEREMDDETAALVFGILVAFGGLFLRLGSIAFGEPRGPTGSVHASYVPMFAHFAIVFIAGIHLPPALVVGFENVAKLLG